MILTRDLKNDISKCEESSLNDIQKNGRLVNRIVTRAESLLSDCWTRPHFIPGKPNSEPQEEELLLRLMQSWAFLLEWDEIHQCSKLNMLVKMNKHHI